MPEFENTSRTLDSVKGFIKPGTEWVENIRDSVVSKVEKVTDPSKYERLHTQLTRIISQANITGSILEIKPEVMQQMEASLIQASAEGSADEKRIAEKQLMALREMTALLEDNEGRELSERILNREELNAEEAFKTVAYLRKLAEHSDTLADKINYSLSDVFEKFTDEIADTRLDEEYRKSLAKEISDYISDNPVFDGSAAAAQLKKFTSSNAKLTENNTKMVLGALDTMSSKVASSENLHEMIMQIQEGNMSSEDIESSVNEMVLILGEMDGFNEEQVELAKISSEGIADNRENIDKLTPILQRLANRTLETKTLHTLQQLNKSFDANTLTTKGLEDQLKRGNLEREFKENSELVSSAKDMLSAFRDSQIINLLDKIPLIGGLLSTVYSLVSDSGGDGGGGGTGILGAGLLGAGIAKGKDILRGAGNLGRRVTGMFGGKGGFKGPDGRMYANKAAFQSAQAAGQTAPMQQAPQSRQDKRAERRARRDARGARAPQIRGKWGRFDFARRGINLVSRGVARRPVLAGGAVAAGGGALALSGQGDEEEYTVELPEEAMEGTIAQNMAGSAAYTGRFQQPVVQGMQSVGYPTSDMGDLYSLAPEMTEEEMLEASSFDPVTASVLLGGTAAVAGTRVGINKIRGAKPGVAGTAAKMEGIKDIPKRGVMGGAAKAGKGLLKGAGRALGPVGAIAATGMSVADFITAGSDAERAQAVGEGLGGLGGFAGGAAAGAAIGSIVPGVGTVIGGIVGGIIGGLGGGAIGSTITSWFTDPEDEIPDEYKKQGPIIEAIAAQAMAMAPDLYNEKDSARLMTHAQKLGTPMSMIDFVQDELGTPPEMWNTMTPEQRLSFLMSRGLDQSIAAVPLGVELLNMTIPIPAPPQQPQVQPVAMGQEGFTQTATGMAVAAGANMAQMSPGEMAGVAAMPMADVGDIKQNIAGVDIHDKATWVRPVPMEPPRHLTEGVAKEYIRSSTVEATGQVDAGAQPIIISAGGSSGRTSSGAVPRSSVDDFGIAFANSMIFT